MKRIGGMWRSGCLGKLTVGCGAIVALVAVLFILIIIFVPSPKPQVSVVSSVTTQVATTLPTAAQVVNTALLTVAIVPSVTPTSTTDFYTYPAPLPGLIVADVKVNLQNRKFECGGTSFGKDSYSWNCTRKDPGGLAEYSVIIVSKTIADVVDLEAVVYQFTDKPSDSVATAFLGFMATMPYDNADPPKARKWVEDNIANGGITTINGVDFFLFGNPKARSFQMATKIEP